MTRSWRIALGLLAASAAVLYFVRLTENPPGFFIDESSIAYNAHTIATRGVDEHGVRWPLYFAAFSDYKNPTFIYVLAALYHFTGPSIFVARLLSALAGVAAAGAIGLLARRISGNHTVGMATTALALLTPWLFQTSRVVMEVALYPLMLALFLLSVHRAATNSSWRRSDVLCVAAGLALLTYTYSIGRLLGPLLAVGLALFWSRKTWHSVLATWCLYGATLIPILVFNHRHPGALTGRFRNITYLDPGMSMLDAAREFAVRYVTNLNVWRLLVTGNPNRDDVTQLHATPDFLFGIFVFAVVGAAVVLRNRFRERWWRFVCYAASMAAVPASLTTDNYHMLRLIGVPVVLLLFAGVGMAWLFEPERKQAARSAVGILIALSVVQAAVFFWRFDRSATSAWRVHLFDGEYRGRIFAPALASGAQPIYIADAAAIPGYIQAYWHATVDGVDLRRFTRLGPSDPPPVGALVITTEEKCSRCDVLAVVEPYLLYKVTAAAPPASPLAREAFAAELVLVSGPRTLQPKAQAAYRVKVKNISPSTWLATVRNGGALQVSLANHWLSPAGEMVVHDDGRSGLLQDLKPSQTTELQIIVNAPRQPGDYILEFDMLQENVSWFALAGSPTIRLPVSIR